jgi:hypothetical protein
MLRAKNETYEVRHDNHGNAIHVVIVDNIANVYASLDNLVRHQYLGQENVPRYCTRVDNLESYYNKDDYNFYTLFDMPKSGDDELYARRCDITGIGFNEGYVINDGDYYACNETAALIILERLGYDSLKKAYKDGVCYYTEWEDLSSEEELYDINGNVVPNPYL